MRSPWRSRRSWGVGVLVLVGIVGLPTVGLFATNHLVRQADHDQARESNSLAAAAVASEVSQSYQERLLVLRDVPQRPGITALLAPANRALLAASLQTVLEDGQFCRLVLRSPGMSPVEVTGLGACWSPPAPTPGPAGIRSLGAAVVQSSSFLGLQLSGVPGHPEATLQAVFAVGSLTAAVMPGAGSHATVVAGTTIMSSTVPTLVGRTLAAPGGRALVRGGKAASNTIYAPLLHTEVIEAFQPVPGTGLGVFYSVSTKVAYGPANHVNQLLFYGYLGLLGLGLGLASLVVIMLRRRDRTARQSERALAKERRRLRDPETIGHIGSWEMDVATHAIVWSDTLLERLGHHVDVVGNGREATEAVRLFPYDVVLMDIEMPEMDGLQATRLIRSELPAHKQLQIVAMTASALAEDRRNCNEAGMDGYLAKPVHLQDLGAALVEAATQLKRKGTTRPRPHELTASAPRISASNHK